MAGKRKAPAAWVVAGTAALRRVQAERHLMPKCGATSKSTGQPCGQFPMENGRCYYHGGRTPKGKDWHKPRWPKNTAPDAEQKMEARLRNLAKQEKRRQKRLAKMTAEERAAYDKWKREHPTGTPQHREAKRIARKQNAEAKAQLSQPAVERPLSPESAAIARRIAELRAQLAAMRDSASDARNPANDAGPANSNLGDIFG